MFRSVFAVLFLIACANAQSSSGTGNFVGSAATGAVDTNSGGSSSETLGQSSGEGHNNFNMQGTGLTFAGSSQGNSALPSSGVVLPIGVPRPVGPFPSRTGFGVPCVAGGGHSQGFGVNTGGVASGGASGSSGGNSNTNQFGTGAQGGANLKASGVGINVAQSGGSNSGGVAQPCIPVLTGTGVAQPVGPIISDSNDGSISAPEGTPTEVVAAETPAENASAAESAQAEAAPAETTSTTTTEASAARRR